MDFSFAMPPFDEPGSYFQLGNENRGPADPVFQYNLLDNDGVPPLQSSKRNRTGVYPQRTTSAMKRPRRSDTEIEFGSFPYLQGNYNSPAKPKNNYAHQAEPVILEAGVPGASVPGPEDLVIVDRGTEADHANIDLYGDNLMNTNAIGSFTLASFNYMLALNQTKDKDNIVKGYYDLKDDAEVDFHDPYSILERYGAFGVVFSDEYENGNATGSMAASSRAMSDSANKLSNVVMAGRTKMKNIFHRVRAGDKTYLILKPQKRPSYYKLTAQSSHGGSPNSKIFTEEQKSKLVDEPFQLVPHVATRDHPDIEDLLYEDQYGIKRQAPYIYVGQVFKGPDSWSIHKKNLMNDYSDHDGSSMQMSVCL